MSTHSYQGARLALLRLAAIAEMRNQTTLSPGNNSQAKDQLREQLLRLIVKNEQQRRKTHKP